MKKKTKINLFIGLLIIGLVAFILQMFVFEAPNGTLGFLLCLTETYLIIFSTIKLCQTSSKIKDFVLNFLDMLFFIR